jgi:hypothetical protein
MKKTFFIIAIMLLTLKVEGQYSTLSNILSHFKTGDKPTEAQFEEAWRNSYNAVSDGMWDLTGYPSIGFVPFTSMQVGKFFISSAYPMDTTVKLGFDGILKVSKLYAGGNLITGSESFFSRNGNEVSLTRSTDQLAIRSNSTSGYDFFVLGNADITESIRSGRVDLVSGNNRTGSLSVDAFGNLQLEDDNAGLVSLSTMVGSTAWMKLGQVISPLSESDTVTIGALTPAKDSLFNVYGTGYFQSPVYFDSTLVVNGNISISDYIKTPSINFAYGAYTGRIDLYTTGGKLKLYDADYPAGVTLLQLAPKWTTSGTSLYPNSTLTNVVIGGTNSLGYKLNVTGTTLFNGNVTFNSGINIINAQKINWPLSSVWESGGVLRFKDPVAGEYTLAQLAAGGTTLGDSISVSRINTDTLFFNGQKTKSLYSPHSNNIYLKNQNALFSFEYKNPMAVLGLGALRFEPSNDSLKSSSGWEEQGKFILRDVDTTFQYATGKTGEWRTLATEEWVSSALSGLGGLNLTLDTLYFNSNTDFLTGGGSHAVKFYTKSPGGLALNFVTGSAPGMISNNNSILFGTSYLVLNHGMGNIYYDATYLRTVADTFATQAYARSFGGGSGGIGSFDIYPDASPDTFVTSSGPNLAYFVTNLFNSSTSFITGYPSTADSVKMGKKLQITNNYISETAIKYSQKLFQDYDGGYLDAYSKVYMNYADANANSSDAFGIFSTIYTNKNFSSSGNTSYSDAGKFVLSNRGTTSIGGTSPGTVYLNGVYGEITGTIDTLTTPGIYKIAAIYGKNSNIGTAKSWAGYFDGNVKIVGYFNDNVLKTASTKTAGKFYTSGSSPSNANLLLYDGNFYVTNMFLTADLYSSVLNTSGGTKTAGYWYTGVSTPTNTNRINFDGNVFSTRFDGIGSTGIGIYGYATSGQGTYGYATTGTGIQGFSESGYLGRFEHNTGTARSTPMVYIAKSTTGTVNNTSVLLSIVDNPSTSGTVSGSLLQGTIVSTVRTDMNPRVANSSSAVAYLFDSQNALTGNAKFMKVSNQGSDEFYVKNDTTVATSNLKYRGSLYDWKYRALTDTFALVMYPGGKYDTAQFTITASKRWDVPLEPFEEFYSKSERLKALPLPLPDGKERRRLNAVYRDYQIEYTLETLTMYLKEERDKNKALEARINDLESKIVK